MKMKKRKRKRKSESERDKEKNKKEILCFRIMPERNAKRWGVTFLSKPISPSINPRNL